MAKIRQQHIKVNGRDLTGEVHYSPGVKFFSFRFPEPVATWAKVKYSEKVSVAQGKSEEELLKRVHEVLKEFHSDKLIERKVIAYKIAGDSSQLELARDIADDPEGEDSLRERAMRRDEEVSLRLEFKVLMERSVAGSHSYAKEVIDHTGARIWDECGRWDYDRDDWKIIEWTPEREAFFWDFYKAIETLIGRLNKFLGSEALVLKAIENKVKLLGVQK